MGDNCVFCDIALGKIPATKIYEDDDVIAFRDINAIAPTHVLIIPRKHIPTLNDIQPDDAALIGKLSIVAKNIAQEEGLAEEGYRTVINCNEGAGQSVFHIHMHLLGGRPFSWPPG